MTVLPPLSDDLDRQAIHDALDDTVIVEAAAGTGKTTELVQRILNVLARGRARIEQIVAVTFTEKAAGELKLRIRKDLENLRQRSSDDEQVRDRLTDAIQRLEDAHVSTIHGFCADLLRERPVEAGVDPLFQVLTEAGSERVFNEAFGKWLHVQLENPPEGVQRALRRSVWSRDGRDDDDGPIERIRRAGRELAEWRDFPAAWSRAPFDRDAELNRVLARVHEVAALTAAATSTRDVLFLDTAAIRELSHDVASSARFDAVDPDGWEARLVDLAQNRDVRRARRGRDRAYGREVARDTVWTAFETLMHELDAFQAAADADLAALLREELRGAIDGYKTLKERAGALDFVDLLLRARDLIAGDAQVRRAFQARFTHLFVDEFQDTDPLQAEILLLLAANDPHEQNWRNVTPHPGKLFIVGDPKQAIYRFRRADVETYREVYELLKDRGARPVFLRTSFRAVPAIQRAVNAAFAPLMTGDRVTLQAEYVPLNASPLRDDRVEQPAVIALPVPEPYGMRRVAGYAIEKSLPDAVGAFVDWLLNESGWTVTERTPRHTLPMRVPVQARHVAILFRRFLHFGADVTRPYVAALEARGVSHLLVGGKSFHEREEVETIRGALAAIEWPDDELSVFATLRGSLFAIDDETLLAYRHVHRSLHPFRVPAEIPPDQQPVVDALHLLGRLHRGRNYRPVGDTITQLLNATRAHVGFVLRPAGQQALANVLHVAELARQYEFSGGLSFRGFVEELRDQADGGQAAEAPILEEGSDGVRLMTVHKAKGLEFPVVILADMTAKLRSDRADRLIDRANNACYLRLGRWTPIELALNEPREISRDEAEGVRVAYVAATRARDLLVLPAVGDVAWDGGWTGPMNGAIYPSIGLRRSPGIATDCPPFKKDSVWRRPDDDPSTPLTVSPGRYTFAGDDGSYSVVWWDPFALRLGVEPPQGIQRESLIVKDVPEAVVAEGLREYGQWRDAREHAIARGSAPSLNVRTVTEWAAEDGGISDFGFVISDLDVGDVRQVGLFDAPPPPDDSARVRPPLDVDIIDLRARGAQVPAGGTRFGDLVHALLAAVPFGADRGAVDDLAAVHGRIVLATDEEMAAASATVARVLSHSILQRARDADTRGACRREAPVTGTVGRGELVEGVVDLAFEEHGEWTVVDYKTDREIAAAGEERYKRQVAFYARAITEATGQSARAVLVRL
jgi:ATP-dependent exoDNAse (exonuclease V) beta subunit